MVATYFMKLALAKTARYPRQGRVAELNGEEKLRWQ